MQGRTEGREEGEERDGQKGREKKNKEVIVWGGAQI